MTIMLSEPAARTPGALTPREIVTELDKYVVGQAKAKRAVAIALRNRYRRQRLPRGHGRRGGAEEHPDDRTDRRRQDRDRAAPRAPGRVALHQGGGLQVHRSGLRRPRRRIDGARPRGNRRQDGARGARDRGAREGAAGRRGAPARSAAAAGRRASGFGEGSAEADDDARPRVVDAREAARAVARRPAGRQDGRDRNARARVARRSKSCRARRSRRSASISATCCRACFRGRRAAGGCRCRRRWSIWRRKRRRS